MAIPLFVIGLFVGIGSTYWVFARKNISVQPVAIRSGQEKLINPLLLCGSQERSVFAELQPLKSVVSAVVNKNINAHTATNVSVYYRDLNAGQWVGVNEGDKYAPASLLKLPLMLSYFKLSENNLQILQDKFVYPGDVDKNLLQSIQPNEHMQSGTSYSYADLIDCMIRYSDNNAEDALVKNQNISVNEITEVFSDLNIHFPTNQNADQDFLSTEEYSMFLRILYNATFLGRTLSEKTLELLTQVDFGNGLRAVVPSDVIVAHKFGERIVNTDKGVFDHREFHDCGIIYFPNHPYLLCVMTKGNKVKDLEKTIQDVSQTVYDYVKKTNQ